MAKRRKQKQGKSSVLTKILLITNIVLILVVGFLFYKVYSNQNYNLSLWSAQSTLDESIPVPTGVQNTQPSGS